jgi:hypothetical protein
LARLNSPRKVREFVRHGNALALEMPSTLETIPSTYSIVAILISK